MAFSGPSLLPTNTVPTFGSSIAAGGCCDAFACRRNSDPSLVPVTKTLFIDLLDPSYKVNATQTIKDVIPEKIESLAWGPDLKDGCHVL